MRTIDIQFIPHLEQRYNTVGDWWEKSGVLHIRVSNLPHVGSMVAIAVHELIEAWFCMRNGVSEDDVTKFDVHMEKTSPDEEPGDNPAAPYHIQHGLATGVERIIVAASNINWREHEDAMEVLMHQYRHERSSL